MQLKPVDQQVVVVMGASSGIGRETALRFARRGARVVVAARGEPGLRSLVDEIRRAGGEATAVVADVVEFAQVEEVASRAAAAYGRLDTWVHLAAVGLYATVEQTAPEEFRRVLEINLLGQIHGAKAALPYLRRAGGSLIHISSIEAKRAFPLHSAYAAAKHGLDGFVEALRVELRHEGAPVNVAQILPASINTPFFNKARTKLGVKPMGAPPIYQPGIVADAILYAAAHPVRDLVVGGAGKQLLLAQRLSPRLLDPLLTRFGFPLQQTDEPAPEDAPHGLLGPVRGYDRAEGDFSDQARARSYTTWLDLHPAVRRGALAGLAVGSAALLARRAGRDDE